MNNNACLDINISPTSAAEKSEPAGAAAIVCSEQLNAGPNPSCATKRSGRSSRHAIRHAYARRHADRGGECLRINDIIFGERFRKDLGDIESLKLSISEIGLLQPIVVTEKNELVAGARRLEACKQLGWTEMPIHRVELADILRGEFEHATHVESIDQFKEAQMRARAFNIQIGEVNTDRDPRFYSNKSSGTSAFEQYLEREGIRHVPSRKGNPQTNGKLERLWLEYDRHRWRFESLDAFLTWYNNRIHGALDYRGGETPAEAFIRRAPPEAILGLFLKEDMWYE
jgi:hypothetical protein